MIEKKKKQKRKCECTKMKQQQQQKSKSNESNLCKFFVASDLMRDNLDKYHRIKTK